MEQITLALIDSDWVFCKEITESFHNYYNGTIRVIGSAHDCDGGLKLLSEVMPDIALISVDLPEAGGVSFIESVKSSEETQDISCILMSDGYANYRPIAAADAGSDYIFAKPLDIHRLAKCLTDLCSYKSGFKKSTKNPPDKPENEIAAAVAPPCIKPEEYASAILVEMGFRSNAKGFYFLKTAMCFCIRDVRLLDMLTKSLYPRVAEVHGSTSAKVERAMRHSIRLTWDSANPMRFKAAGGVWNTERPTVGAFLRSMVDDYTNRYGAE
ncbi:MAG: hypothetical protein LBS19_15775 [Clostridiales bacterium]|jgi:two-component system response regulator (stage 0 sporulation protein A)|nr:hypothetical protein [Clostridiales bacterium]